MSRPDPDLEALISECRHHVAYLKKVDWVGMEGRNQAEPARLGAFATRVIRPLVEETQALLDRALVSGEWAHVATAFACLGDVVALVRNATDYAGRVQASSLERGRAIRELLSMVAKGRASLSMALTLETAPSVAVTLTALMDARAHVEDTIARTDAASDRINDLANQLSKRVQEQEVILGSGDFAYAEAAQESLSVVWLVGAAVAAIALLASASVGIANAAPPLPAESWLAAGNVAYFASRALLVSVLSYALAVCVRGYRASKHNEIVNGHRSRALRTFGTLRLAAGEGRAQDLLLAQAMGAIFSSQPTGYASGTGDGTHVAELVAALAPKKED